MIETTAQPAIELNIRVDPVTHKVGVHGPLADKMLCFQLLAHAMQLVIGYDPAKEPGIISVPAGIELLKGR